MAKLCGSPSPLDHGHPPTIPLHLFVLDVVWVFLLYLVLILLLSLPPPSPLFLSNNKLVFSTLVHLHHLQVCRISGK